ncbi:MAG: tetratricopeptide repeat protein [Melioribacter sp.]|nr:tetratricopeptide repeat protein [Melioribacter sp.]
MNKKKYFLFILIFSVILSGCSLWRDFTTYFNTYYNAITLFEKTEEEILSKKNDAFAFRLDPPTPQQIKDLTKVIEKCSKILQFNKESSFFDDALFLTGKAFYYQQEYARAQRKFIELSYIPQSSFKLENKIWLAKTHLQLRNFEEGIKLLEEAQKEALINKKENLFIDASTFKISFYIFRQDYRKAIDECQNFIDNLKNDETIALVYYQMGKIYLKLEENDNALNAFASVLRHSPTFDIEFESRLEYSKLLKELGKLEESEKSLNELLYQGKFKDQEDRILLELAQIYDEKNDLKKATEILKQIDSTYKQKPTAGLADLILGKIYEYKIQNYDSSYKYYNKAAASSITKELKDQATSRIRIIDKYFALKKNLDELYLQLNYITDNTKFIRDSIDYEIAYNQYLEETKKKQEQNAQSINIPISQRLQERGIQTPQQKEKSVKTDSAKYSDKKLSLIELIAQGKAKKPIRPKISVDSITTLISQNLYNIGNLFLNEIEIIDSAKSYFNEIIEKYPNKSYIVDALFALGTHYETLNEKDKADSLFKLIYDNYPNHKLYKEAGKKLGLIKSEDITLLTTNDPAEKLYLEAEEMYYNKKYQEAINSFRKIYLNYPRSSYAPKSILYIGMIYEERNQNDSAAFFYGILSSRDYASTPYGKAVIAKYTTYKNEKERLEKEEAEKKKLEEQKTKQLELEEPKIEKSTNKNIVNPDKNLLQEKTDSSSRKIAKELKTNLEKSDTTSIDTSKKQRIRFEE